MTKETTPPDYGAMADAILKIALDLCRQARDAGNAEQRELAERLKRIAAEMRATPAIDTSSP